MPEPRVIIHLPHASDHMPSLEGFVGDWRGEIDLLTDWGTDRLFDLEGTVTIAAPFSRVFCDVERFDDDAREPMAARGMGFVYTHADDGHLLRRVSDDLRDRIRREWYHVHHRRLSMAVRDAFTAGRDVVLIDGHSFSDAPFRRDPDQRLSRPDICIGTDARWSASSVVDAMLAVCHRHGLRAERDAPYAGTMVPQGTASMAEASGRDFHSYMIEINRRLYLDGTRCREDALCVLKPLVRELIRAAVDDEQGSRH